MSETDELAHWLRTLANIPLLNVEISDRYTAAADALEQAQKQLDQAYGDIASIRDEKNRRIAELEAALRNLVSAENDGESFEDTDPNFSLVPISTVNMIDDALDVAEKVLSSAGINGND